MSDYTVHVESDGQEWVWHVDLPQADHTIFGSCKHIDEAEDAARRDIIKSDTIARYAGFTTDVVLAYPYVPDPSLPPAVVCDIDGTAATRKDRGPFDFNLVENDDVNPSVADFLTMYGHTTGMVIMLSGRDEEYRPHTERWLKKHEIRYDKLHMRPVGDRRSDDIVKLELFDAHVRDHFNVTHVLDDRDRLIYLWRKLGLPAWQVSYGAF